MESQLWEAADQLRANSKLTSSEYCMPVLGVILLRHASNRYNAALVKIVADQSAGRMPNRPLVKGDFIRRRALMLPEKARYDELLRLPKGANLGTALVKTMNAIVEDFEPLKGQLPKEYDCDMLLPRLMSGEVEVCAFIAMAPLKGHNLHQPAERDVA